MVGVRRRRTRKLRAHRSQHPTIAGLTAQFRARNLFHGIDQRRQPSLLAVCRSPSLKLLLAHWLFPAPVPSPSRLPILPSPTRSRRLWLKRKLTGCDLLHIRLGRAVLNVRNGPENLPIIVRSAGRHRYRLRPDCQRRWRSPGRADLSPPDLIQRLVSGLERVSPLA